MKKHRAIALLVTVFFIIAISIPLGISLKQVKEASGEVASEIFMLQSTLVVEDVLNILKNSKELEAVVQESDVKALWHFLSKVTFIPFQSNGLEVSIEIASARSKFNPNTLLETNTTHPLGLYLSNFDIKEDYVALLLDNIGGIKEDNSYNSDIFEQNPTLFRDYIVSQKHLDEINNFYMQNSHENAIAKIDFEKLFYFSSQKNYFIDVNYATKEVWRLMLGCGDERAKQLFSGGGLYAKEEDLALSEAETEILKRFKTTFYEPHLDVKIRIGRSNQSAFVRFEYDMKTKKGSNFVYEI
ncbi:MAG: hypothetical protein OEL19_00155 [Sulfurimonas sp.]|nr:hypothetical protein [Sulfurimonas sp.]